MKKSIFIFLFALLGVLSARAYDFEVGGIYYNIITGTDQVEVTSSGSSSVEYSGSVVIPSTVTYDGTTYTVTSIGSYAFFRCTGLTSVVIEESVTSIGSYAFFRCTGLTSVVIEESVTTIGSGAFRSCSGLKSVTIPESVTTIGPWAFYDCTSISSPLYNSKVFVYMPQNYSGEYTILSGIQSIAGTAFADCTGLTSVTIPESVTSIGLDAFYGCTGIHNPSYNSKIFAYMPVDYKGGYSIPSGIQTIVGGAFSSCSGLTSVTIPESVDTIEDFAFSRCDGLTSVEWNAVACYASQYNIRFGGCENITNITFGNQVTHIPNRLCEDLGGLTSVTIPNNVTTIGMSAFNNCTSLTSVTIGESVTSIGGGAFQRCSGLTLIISKAENPPYFDFEDDYYGYAPRFSDYSATLLVPRGCKAAYQKAQEWSNFTTIYESGFDGTGLVTVQPNDTTMGRVTGGGEYEIDEEIKIEAIPNEGYHFVKWDDENTDNPRTLTVIADIALTAIFAQDNPTANENSEADNFRVYVQDRTIHLSEDRGLVQLYNMAGQCVYNGRATAIPVPQSGVYIVVAGSQRCKVLVR